mgnify:CR=1 FL=1
MCVHQAENGEENEQEHLCDDTSKKSADLEPRRIHEIVEIPTPLAERTATDPDLAKQQDHLWRLMKDEALAADQELANA